MWDKGGDTAGLLVAQVSFYVLYCTANFDLKRLLNSDKVNSYTELESKLSSELISILDYGNVIYVDSAASTFKHLRFIALKRFGTHLYLHYEKAGLLSLAVRREKHCILFISKASHGKLNNVTRLFK